MIQETKKVEVPVRKWWQVFSSAPSVEKTIATWTRKGWAFLSTTPVTDERGKTIKHVVTFEKE